MASKREKNINPESLPHKEVFNKKEIFQHPPPADAGKPLKSKGKKEFAPAVKNSKEQDKTSKEQGLNEERSSGAAGAFEGFEDQSSNE